MANVLSKKDRLEISKVLKDKGLIPLGASTIELAISPEGIIGNVNIKVMFLAQKDSDR